MIIEKKKIIGKNIVTILKEEKIFPGPKRNSPKCNSFPFRSTFLVTSLDSDLRWPANVDRLDQRNHHGHPDLIFVTDITD